MIDVKISKKITHLVPLSNPYKSDVERFFVVFENGESELFDFDAKDNQLFWVETEKLREHDCNVSDVSYNMTLRLIVTGDEKGIIRIWNYNKKFLREIQLPC